jgi:hypothetical protein
MNPGHTRIIQHGPRGVARRLSLVMLLLCGAALAGDVRYEASHVTSKSPEQIWNIITDYSNICNKGCKYRRPDLVVVKKISYKTSANSWYTWSHVDSTLRAVTYFTHVSITRRDDGNIVANNRQVHADDKRLIAELEQNSGLKHAPAFDVGNTQTVTASVPGGKTRVTQVVTLTTSGMLAMWTGKVREQMKENVKLTFENIGN